jgi:hypothetical protein
VAQAQYYQNTCTVTLQSGQNNDATHMDVTGAKAVTWTVSCNTTHTLSTASPQVLFTDGKQLTIAPGAFPGGTDGTTTALNATGIITGADLSTTTPRIVLLRSNTNTQFLNTDRLWGAGSAWLTITKAATAGPAIYTIVTTVYY